MRYRFNNVEIDLDSFELRRDGRVIPVRKTTFDVLCYLIEHRNRVITKKELLDKVWTDTNVAESAVAWYISNLRKALGQQRGDRTPVETVHGRGYQFKSDVQVIEESSVATETYAPRQMGEIDDLFVGRQEVMAYLTHALNSVVGGRGSILMLRGEAGIGKTRCALEFLKDVVARGYGVWMGRCSETASQPPFWPWIQILRNARSEQPNDLAIRRESSRLLSNLVPHEGVNNGYQQADDLHGTTDKFWLYDRLFDFLRTSCTAAPRVLIIDDIHWADEASLEFLSFIAPEAASLRMLMIVTLRDFEEMGSRDVYVNHLLRYTTRSSTGRSSKRRGAIRCFYTKRCGGWNGVTQRVKGNSRQPTFINWTFLIRSTNCFAFDWIASTRRPGAYWI
jgi:DNA-binding winged helix-turn-helix (wHTH) protein